MADQDDRPGYWLRMQALRLLRSILPAPAGATVDPSIPLWQIKHDYELHPTGDFTARPAEVFRLAPFNHILLTEERQRLWFRQMEIEGEGLTRAELLQAWRWITDHNRAFTNGNGCDIRRDYILGLRSDEPLPKMFPLLSGGNVVTGRVDGSDLVVRTIGPEEAADSELSYRKCPYLIHYATVSTMRKLWNRTYMVMRFSTKTWVSRNAPVPLLADWEVRYPLSKLKRIPSGFAPSPYNY